MKIYFEDGYLCLINAPSGCKIVDATYGYYDNYRRLELYKQTEAENTIIYTNSLVALSNDYCWDETNNRPDLYLRDISGAWKNCQDLTEKEIRYAHNLEKLYVSGTFKTKLRDTWNV